MTNSIPVEAYCCTPRGAAGGVALLGVSVTAGSIYALAVGSSAIPIIGIVIGVALAIFGTYLLYQDYKEKKLEEEKTRGFEALKILTQPVDVQEKSSSGAPIRFPLNMSFEAMHQMAAPPEPEKIDPPATEEREEIPTVKAEPQILKKERPLPPKDEDDQIEQEPEITPIVLKGKNVSDEYTYLKVAGSVALLVITVAASCYLLV